MRRILTEKFDPSMPGWLRKRLLYTDDRSPSDVGYQSRDIHPRRRSDSVPSEGLFKEFVKKNIDLSNAKFTSADPKSLQKRNDPRLKERYLPIFHIVTNEGGSNVDTVYAVGINDTDKWPGRGAYDELADKAFRSIPLKRIIELSQDFCYLDLEDPDNFIDEERGIANLLRSRVMTDYDDEREQELIDTIKSARANSWDEYQQRYTPIANTKYSWRSTKNLRSKDTGKLITAYQDEPKEYSERELAKTLDKSGYLKNPNKYAAKLKELKAKNYTKVLNDIYSRIKTIQVGMVEAFSDYNFKNLQGNISSSVFSGFQELVKNYNELLSKVDRVVRDFSDDPDMFSTEIQGLFDPDSYDGYEYRQIINKLRDLERQVIDYINVPVDWDVEEDDEFTESLRLSESLFEDIDNLDDGELVLNPVMYNAKRQSKRTSDKIGREVKNLKKFEHFRRRR